MKPQNCYKYIKCKSTNKTKFVQFQKLQFVSMLSPDDWVAMKLTESPTKSHFSANASLSNSHILFMKN